MRDELICKQKGDRGDGAMTTQHGYGDCQIFRVVCEQKMGLERGRDVSYFNEHHFESGNHKAMFFIGFYNLCGTLLLKLVCSREPLQNKTNILYNFSYDFMLIQLYRDPFNEAQIEKLLKDDKD